MLLNSKSDADTRRKCRCSTSGTVETCNTVHTFRTLQSSVGNKNLDKAGTTYILPVATVINTGDMDGGRPGTAICLLWHSIKTFQLVLTGCENAPQTRRTSCVVKVFLMHSVEATIRQAYSNSSDFSLKVSSYLLVGHQA